MSSRIQEECCFENKCNVEILKFRHSFKGNGYKIFKTKVKIIFDYYILMYDNLDDEVLSKFTNDIKKLADKINESKL